MTESVATDPFSELQENMLRRLSRVVADHIMSGADEFFAHRYHNGKLEVGIRDEQGKEHWAVINAIPPEHYRSPAALHAHIQQCMDELPLTTACCGGGACKTTLVDPNTMGLVSATRIGERPDYSEENARASVGRT